ncbi:MAG: hypothetical protein PHQ64_02500 [Bacilli bacterium]|nr:hypothetical protein [Bacilli bacterium]
MIEEIPFTKNLEIDKLLNDKKKYDDYYKLKRIIGNYYLGLGLDRDIYKLDNPKSFEEFNSILIKVLKILKDNDVEIKYELFDYNEEVNLYMNKIIINLDDENINELTRPLFSELYWKNHNLFKDIVLNLKDIININQSKIIDYNLDKLEKYIIDNNINMDLVDNEFIELKEKIEYLNNIDKNNITKKIIDNIYNIDDYIGEDNNYNKAISSLIDIEKYKDFSDSEEEFFITNIKGLDELLCEYEIYNQFKYLIKNLAIMYPKKESFNGIHLNKKKELELLEKDKKEIKKLFDKEISSYNKLLNKKVSIFFSDSKKKKEITKLSDNLNKIDNDLDKKVFEIRKLESELSLAKFQSLIFEKINDNSTILDVFNLYRNNYNYLINVVSSCMKGKSLEEIIAEVDKFNYFMDNHLCSIICGITFIEAEKITSIIEDKYRLLGYNIKIDKYGSSIYNELKKNLNCIKGFIYIIKSGTSIEEYKSITNNNVEKIEG